MAAAKDTNVHDLLNTLLVPTYPPNRSQWKKLELALKFINMSKKRVRESKSTKETGCAKKNKKTGRNGSQNHEPEPKKLRITTDVVKKIRVTPKDESTWTKMKDSLQHLM